MIRKDNRESKQHKASTFPILGIHRSLQKTNENSDSKFTYKPRPQIMADEDVQMERKDAKRWVTLGAVKFAVTDFTCVVQHFPF